MYLAVIRNKNKTIYHYVSEYENVMQVKIIKLGST